MQIRIAKYVFRTGDTKFRQHAPKLARPSRNALIRSRTAARLSQTQLQLIYKFLTPLKIFFKLQKIFFSSIAHFSFTGDGILWRPAFPAVLLHALFPPFC